MPARESDVKLIVVAYGKSFSLNCEEMPFNQYRVKVGRTLSSKIPYATATQIAEEVRKFMVMQQRLNDKFNYSGMVLG